MIIIIKACRPLDLTPCHGQATNHHPACTGPTLPASPFHQGDQRLPLPIWSSLLYVERYSPAPHLLTTTCVPEWYLLPYYAILRSVPNKLLGVVAMLASLLILLAMPLLDTGRVRGSQFRPLARVSFWALVSILGVLLFLGSQHAEEPYVTLGAIATVLYFGWYLVLTPVVGLIENTLADLADPS
ncbi:MAG: hypothetical protein EOP33_05490 [Rickettsiaceae bacterium]|nr:MAG: hypothetical protein EOP33_05490 [Rickettsiaceae bacterium]